MFRIERVDPASPARDEWEAFLDRETDGTLFHRLSFLDYHPTGRFTPHFLRVWRKDRVVGLVPFAEGDEDSPRSLGTPFGGSFGGLAAAPGLGAPDHVAILDAICDYAESEGYARLWISSRPTPYRVLGDGFEFALHLRGAEVTAREVTHIADLRGDEEARRGRVRGSSRRGASKAERLGTEVTIGGPADLPEFHAVLTEDRARFGARPTHSLAELQFLFERRPDDYHLYVARNANEVVGGKLVFRAVATIGLGFYTAKTSSEKAERCTNLLTAFALEDLAARGYRWLDLGTSSLRGELNPGLSEFKEGFGGRPFLRETWRLDLPTRRGDGPAS